MARHLKTAPTRAKYESSGAFPVIESSDRGARERKELHLQKLKLHQQKIHKEEDVTVWEPLGLTDRNLHHTHFKTNVNILAWIIRHFKMDYYLLLTLIQPSFLYIFHPSSQTFC